MTAQKHIIHKVKFDVSFGSKAAAMEGQQSFLQFFKKEVSPALGALLDNYAVEEELRSIEVLKIDLGKIAERPNWKRLSSLLLSQLEKQLTKNASPSTSSEKAETMRSKMEVLQNAILHYLEKGRLPEMPFAIELEKDLLTLIQQRPAQLLRALQQAISRSPEIVILRLSRQWDEKTLWALVEAQASSPQYQAFLTFFKALQTAKFVAIRKWEEVAWQAILSNLFQENKSTRNSTTGTKATALPPSFLPEFLEKIFTQLAIKPAEDSPQKESLIENIRSIKHPALHEALTVYLDAKSSAPKAKKTSHLDTDVPEPKGRKTQIAEAGEHVSTESSPHKKQGEIPIPAGGLYGEMVGAILLHPFLPTYFTACGLLDEKGQFLSPEAAEKGVFLLYFLATGNTKPKEFELTFQKAICGLPIAFPLSNSIDISEEEQKEGEKLLAAAINYWSALGKTSIGGLREGFLQRQGKISEGPEGWVLQVERKTIDILLDKLPWNISIIRFSWLDRLLRVEWT